MVRLGTPPEPLVAALAEGRAVLVLGPGLSHAQPGLDLAAALEVLRTQIAETAGWEALDLLDRAQLFVEAHGRARLDTELAALLPSVEALRPQVTDFQKCLIGLPFPVIVTTGPEALAEAVLAELDLPSRPVDEGADLAAALGTDDGSRLLVRLRGDPVGAAGTAFTREDLLALPSQKSAIFELLRALARDHTFVFYGFSLSDPLFQFIETQVLASPLRSGTSWALMKEPNGLLVQAWARRRVEIVAGNTWTELERWVEGLPAQIARRRRTPADLEALLEAGLPEQRAAVLALAAETRTGFARRLAALEGFAWLRWAPCELPEVLTEPPDVRPALAVLIALERGSLPVPAAAFAVAAELLVKAGLNEAARQAVDHALRVARRDEAYTPALRASLGRSLCRLGALSQARPLLERALAEGADRPEETRAADLAWLCRCLLERADELRERHRERALRELLGRFLVTFAPHFELARTPLTPSADPEAEALRWSVFYINYRLGRLFTLASDLAGQSGAVYAQQAIELLARAVELGPTKPEPYRALRPLLLAPRGFRPDNKRWERVVTQAPAEVRRKLEELELQETRGRGRRG